MSRRATKLADLRPIKGILGSMPRAIETRGVMNEKMTDGSRNEPTTLLGKAFWHPTATFFG